MIFYFICYLLSILLQFYCCISCFCAIIITKYIDGSDCMLKEMLASRNLPALKPRDEMLGILQREVYGFLPPKPDDISFTQEKDIIRRFCAGKANCDRITVNCRVDGREFSFPILATIPNDRTKGKYPLFIHINFRPDNPDRYMPTEEIIDNGFALISLCYADVTSDDGDFTNGLAGILFPDGKRPADGAGKIAMWAWAAQRALDYAETLGDIIDLDRVCVCGHSRLGKTALFTAATDPRFAFAYSNGAGCSGAAIQRGKTGETVADIVDRFPFWFCENYYKYANNEDKMPFDQHYLIASIAPRRVFVGSAEEDAWADPLSEFLSCVAASPAFEKGIVCPDRVPETGDRFPEGDVGWQIRPGVHYFSRLDWQRLIEFIKLHS